MVGGGSGCVPGVSPDELSFICGDVFGGIRCVSGDVSPHPSEDLTFKVIEKEHSAGGGADKSEKDSNLGVHGDVCLT